MASDPEVLVVGGGPAGAAAAFWLARAGHEVMLVEKKSFPREKTCGDGLTPRAILQLEDMGFDFTVGEFHRIDGLRSYAGERFVELRWPENSRFPNWGGVIRRLDLDAQVATLVGKEGVEVREHTEALPVMDGGWLAGVDLAENGDVQRLDPQVIVIADGSLSRFGRVLGTERRRDYPMGLAARGYYASPRSDDRFMESQLDLRDGSGATMPGYGWVFPLGDGTVNVGVGLLSTFSRWKSVNTTDMMRDYVATAPDYWELSEDGKLSEPRGGKLSMSLSVGPRVGRNWVVVGDAAGAINPWNGEGISYGYETGRLAAHHISQALQRDDLTLLPRYEQSLDEEYGLYFKMARIFVKAIGNPWVMRTLAHAGLNSKPLMEWTLKVMTNLLEEDEKGIGEQVYGTLAGLVKAAPTD